MPNNTKNVIEDQGNNCYVSIASYWEIGIKNKIGRLDLNADLHTIFQIIADTGFEALPITTNHILKNSELELFHQDPFDRIIIAQSLVENMKIITKDGQFSKYTNQLLWEN